MKKNLENIELQTDIMREGNVYIAYSPALDLSSCGDTAEDAKKSFKEAARLFIETIVKMGTYKEVLLDLGWQEKKGEMLPPLIISREMISIPFPVLA